MSQRKQQEQKLLEDVKAVHQESGNNYGALKTWWALKAQGKTCGRHTVAKLRQKHAIVAKRVKRFNQKQVCQRKSSIAPNLLNRQFHVDQPNRIWVGDITYLPSREGWLHLAVVIDLYSRKVVGWSMNRKPNQLLVQSAIMMAIEHRQPSPGLIFHSDQGVQYTSIEYQRLLKQHDIIPSMSRRGKCRDNAVVESFFSNLKFEMEVSKTDYQSQIRSAVFQYIELFFNRKRIHQTLNYLSPVQYEMMQNVA